MIAGQAVYSHSCMLKIEEATQDTTTETKELALILLNISELIGSGGYGFGVKTEPTSLEKSADQNNHWKPFPK